MRTETVENAVIFHHAVSMGCRLLTDHALTDLKTHLLFACYGQKRRFTVEKLMHDLFMQEDIVLDILHRSFRSHGNMTK